VTGRDRHQVAVFLDAAYARACPPHDGARNGRGGDDVPVLVQVWAHPETGSVEVTIDGTNVRLDLPPGTARWLAGELAAEAAKVPSGQDFFGSALAFAEDELAGFHAGRAARIGRPGGPPGR
jgi:hypothetical protein